MQTTIKVSREMADKLQEIKKENRLVNVEAVIEKLLIKTKGII